MKTYIIYWTIYLGITATIYTANVLPLWQFIICYAPLVILLYLASEALADHDIGPCN